MRRRRGGGHIGGARPARADRSATVRPPCSRLISRAGHSRRGQVPGAVRAETATAAPAASSASSVCASSSRADGARSRPSQVLEDQQVDLAEPAPQRRPAVAAGGRRPAASA